MNFGHLPGGGCRCECVAKNLLHHLAVFFPVLQELKLELCFLASYVAPMEIALMA